MVWNSGSFITIADLYVAYRKAKVDMFYERDHVTAVDFCIYEENLDANLRSLFVALQAAEPTWHQDRTFVGGFGYVPKSLDPNPSAAPGSDSRETAADSRFVTSDPDAAWECLVKEKPHTAKFRIVGRHPIAFHVVSALWLQKVGHLYDGILTQSAYGSRLRRMRGQGGNLGAQSRRPEWHIDGQLSPVQFWLQGLAFKRAQSDPRGA